MNTEKFQSLVIGLTAASDRAIDERIDELELINQLLTQELAKLREENALLKAELSKQENSEISTHNAHCYDYGRRHYECALQKVKQLETELTECKRDAEKYRKELESISILDQWCGGNCSYEQMAKFAMQAAKNTLSNEAMSKGGKDV